MVKSGGQMGQPAGGRFALGGRRGAVKPGLLGMVVGMTLVMSPWPASVSAAEAHVHGQADLLLVQDGTVLLLEWRSPAVNLLGFEHAPTTPAEQDQLAAVTATLGEAGWLLSAPPVGCTMSAAEVTPPVFVAAASAAPAEHDHDHGDHPADHADFTVRYTFDCPRAVAGADLAVVAFERFPGLTEVNVQWALAGGQGGMTLTPTRARIPLP